MWNKKQTRARQKPGNKPASDTRPTTLKRHKPTDSPPLISLLKLFNLKPTKTKNAMQSFAHFFMLRNFIYPPKNTCSKIHLSIHVLYFFAPPSFSSNRFPLFCPHLAAVFTIVVLSTWCSSGMACHLPQYLHSITAQSWRENRLESTASRRTCDCPISSLQRVSLVCYVCLFPHADRAARDSWLDFDWYNSWDWA